jgi:hypothetical protein
MKKKEQLQALIIINYICALIMFITALSAKAHVLIPFGFVILICTTIIRFAGKSETIINIRKNNNTYETKINKSTFSLPEYATKQWNRFITWLNT